MLDSEDISHVAVRNGLTLMSIEPSSFYTFRDNFAKEVYELGRQHQRESDASLCETHDLQWGAKLAYAIRSNTGDIS